jgi:hypothetical protein
MRAVRRRPRVYGPLAIVFLLLSGCDPSSPTEPSVTARPLPLEFSLLGTAELTTADGSSVSCLLELYFELSEPPRQAPQMLEYDGVHGGSIQRTVLDPAGNGISLWPDVHGAVIARSIAPETVEVLIPVNADAEGRFWRELSRFEGRWAPDGTATGAWNCAPFDIDEGGSVDTRFTAPGSWTLRPI